MTNPTSPAADVTVILHGWHWYTYTDNGVIVRSQEHASERPDQEPDGWCVYTRHDYEIDPADDVPFDLSNEQDFDTYEEALAEAQRRAAEYGIEHMED